MSIEREQEYQAWHVQHVQRYEMSLFMHAVEHARPTPSRMAYLWAKARRAVLGILGRVKGRRALDVDCGADNATGGMIPPQEDAWALIANAWAFVEREGGESSEEWIGAAERWRDRYHAHLSGGRVSHGCPPGWSDERWVYHLSAEWDT